MVRTLSRTVLRLSLVTALFSLLQDVLAQKPEARDLLMRLNGLNGRDQEKTVLAAINDQDPFARVSMDVPSQQVKVRTTVTFDRPSLDAALAAQGITIINLGLIHAGDHVERTTPAGVLPGFPSYMDTGDPALDEAAYQAAKTIWIAAHPALYPPPAISITPDQR